MTRTKLALFSLVLTALVPHAGAQVACGSPVFEEGFDGGVLPAGWSAGPFWSVTADASCAPACTQGFYALYGLTGGVNCSCDGSCFPLNGCLNGSFLESPAIVLPDLAAGETLRLDFCLDSWLDTITQSCHFLRIETGAGNTDFKLGKHVFAPCVGPEFLPPFDLTPFAGEVIRLHWLSGSVDCEGRSYMKLDDVRVTRLTATGSLDCNANGEADQCDIADGTSNDFDLDGVPDECQCASEVYCVSALNSTGQLGRIDVSGSLSVTLNDTTLTAIQLPPAQFGIFYFGTAQAQTPFGDGWRCVGGQVERLLPAIQIDAGGNALRFLDLQAPPLSNLIGAGDTRDFQFWYRDPNAGGAGFNLTDAIEITFCP